MTIISWSFGLALTIIELIDRLQTTTPKTSKSKLSNEIQAIKSYYATLCKVARMRKSVLSKFCESSRTMPLTISFNLPMNSSALPLLLSMLFQNIGDEKYAKHGENLLSSAVADPENFGGGGFEAQNLKNSDVFTKIESDVSAEIGNSNIFFAQIQVVSKTKKKKKKKKVFTKIETDFSPD